MREKPVSDGPEAVLPRERCIELSPQPITALSMEKLGCFEGLEHLTKFSSILPLSEPMSDEGPLLSEMPDTLVDIDLRTIELGLQFG
jgi:hypothetical protein